MSFEYRELTTQVFLNAGEKSPGHCDDKTKRDDDFDCPKVCGGSTTVDPCACVDNLTPVTIGDDKDKGDYQKREALAFLRQQLRGALAAE